MKHRLQFISGESFAVLTCPQITLSLFISSVSFYKKFGKFVNKDSASISRNGGMSWTQ